MNLGAFFFHAPWALLGLTLLPVLWWLIRFLPPPPRRIWFPPVHLLEGLSASARALKHPNRWLLLLRMLICVFVLAAMSEIYYAKDLAPRLDKEAVRLIVMDNGWASATDWQERKRALLRLIDEAERDERPVLLLTSASAGEDGLPEPENATKVRLLAEALEPLPWAVSRTSLAVRLEAALEENIQGRGNPYGWIQGVETIWIDDGVEQKIDAGGSEKLAAVLQRLGKHGVAPRRLTKDSAAELFSLLALRPAMLSEDADAVLMSLPQTSTAKTRSLNKEQVVSVEAFNSNGERLSTLQLELDTNSRETPFRFDLPTLSTSKIARIAIRAKASAAAVLLRGSSAHRLPAVLLDDNPSQAERPYYSGLYYLRRAISPFAQTHIPIYGEGKALERLLEEAPAVVILDDVVRLSPSERRTLESWVERGGILIRFAGPRTVRAQASLEQRDQLLPMQLRQDERVLGGVLSWDAPRHLAVFEENSPFHGLDIPEEVVISRQILSLPDSSGGGERVQIWARLVDGSPLVSARVKGRGLLVLFHTTASPGWSTLPLSGLYVEMLRRIFRLSPGPVTPTGHGSRQDDVPAARAPDSANMLSLRPVLNLDGFGVLGAPTATARAIAANSFANVQASADHPPGFYGNVGYLESVNVLDADSKLLPLHKIKGESLTAIPVAPLEGHWAISLTQLFLWLALLLFLFDFAVALKSMITRDESIIQGRVAETAMKNAVATRAIIMCALLFMFAFTFSSGVQAQEKSEGESVNKAVVAKPVPEALRIFTLAYVRTGSNEIDTMSHRGLRGLARELHARTTVYSEIHAQARPSDPIAVDIENDELAFFPLLYWPMVPEQDRLSPRAVEAVNNYLRHGGMILFDTRDRHLGAASLDGGSTLGERALRRLLSDVDIPPLLPASQEHALGRSFYLLDEFPGRYAGGRVWVAREEGEAGDRKVSPVVIGGHDWAAAWAINAFDRPMILPLPGRERQREMARRFGVNLVLYALTGTYKQDQVHLPILLERLAH